MSHSTLNSQQRTVPNKDLVKEQLTNRRIILLILFNSLLFIISQTISQLVINIMDIVGIKYTKYHIIWYITYIIFLFIIVLFVYKQITIN